MHPFRKILFICGIFLATSVLGQNQTENIVQVFATANFNGLKSYWAAEVEMSVESSMLNKIVNADIAQQTIVNFYNQKGVIHFEKTADRQLGNITYVTGKLISEKSKYNLTIMLQQNKKELSIISIRIN